MSDISTSDYKRPGTLKFWCQKVLPLVYDDSLSYYELLCKVVDYINNLIHDNSATIDNVDALLNAFNQLQDYVNESFDELNVYNEVSEKIDRMAEDGELLEILEPVTDELTQYVRDQATAQQEYNAQTRSQTNSAILQQNEYNEQTRDMVSAMVGHPFTASTPSQMSDTTKIYVYTGATGGGYTYGHWYYYNGSAWIDGGEYNSTTIELDRSLNIPDTAADAGSVGVRLRQFAPRKSWTSNYRLNPSTGAAESYTGQSTEHAITDFIDCVDMSDILGFDYTSGLGGIITCSVFIYDENSTYLGYIFNSAQYGYVTPSGTMSPLASAPAFQKIRFDVNITTYTAEQFPYNYLDIMTVRRIGTDKSLKAINVPADAEAVGIEFTHVKQDINELENQLKPLYGEMALSLVPNSYWPSQGASAGIPTAYTGWSRTNRISCVPGGVLYITATVASTYNVFFNTDTDGDVNARLVLSAGENIVTVPNGAHYFGLSNTTAGMEATKVVKIISADDVADVASNAVSALSIASQNTVDIDGIERYVGLTSSNYVYPVTSLEVSSPSQRKTTASSAKSVNAVTVNAGSGFLHNINYYKVSSSDADAVSENSWQSGETTLIKPEGYNYWYVRFKKSDNTNFTSSDVESLLANVIVTLTAETIDIPKQTVYVSTSGSDDNDGSATSPFKTLQKAVDSGALVIRAAAGEYTGFRIVSRKTPLTIMLCEMPSQYATSTPDVPKIKITTGIATLGYGVYATGCVSVELSDIWVDGVSGDCFRFDNVGSVKCERCYASGNEATDNSMGFRINNCNGTFNDCVAWDINKDGFNIHRYGNTEFINCVAHDCGDDGISHHDGCTGLILGGEYYNCYKGGVSSPYGGSKVDIHGVYIHDNTQYGIYSMSTTEMLKSAGRISNCAIKNNGSYDIIASYTGLIGWNNIYDTKSIGTQATFTEISQA